MARSYHSLKVNLKRLLTQKSNEEEGGTQYVQDSEISDSLGFVHAIPELPTKPSYFIIVMLPPPDIEDDTLLHGEVELLFAADTMYHLGFSAKSIWYVFKDAILPGVENGSEAKYHIERLTFKGSYQDVGMDFEKLIIGFLGQLETYRVLADHKHASRRLLVQVLCRNVVTFSEPMRFPFLFKLNLTTFQLGNLYAVLDVPVKKNEAYRNVSYHFNDWSNYSEKCRQGREKFDTEWQRSDPEFSKYILSGIPTFDALLNFVGLLSNKNHKKSYKEDEPEKHIKHSFGNPEDRKKDGGDEDSPTDKDGNKERQKRKDTSSAWFFEAPMMSYHWIDRALDITKVRYCSENIKRLTYFSSYEVCGKIIGSFFAKDHPHHKVTASPAFNWIGPRMYFIADTNGPSKGVPWVLACFSNNLLRKETWKLADGSDSQRISVCMKEAIEAVLLMIENPARANAHISIAMEFTKMITGAHGNVQGEQPLIAVTSKRLYGEGYDDRIPDVTLIIMQLVGHISTVVGPNTFTAREFTEMRTYAHGNVQGEQPLIAVSSKRLYGEGYDDRIPDVTLIIMQLVGHISTVVGPNTFTAREFTEMRTYVHGSVPGEPPLEEPLTEASAEQSLGRGYDDSDKKWIHGVTPINNKQLGEPLLEEPLIGASAEQLLGGRYDDSDDKMIPGVTPNNKKQLGEPLLEDRLTEARTEQFLGKGYDDRDKRVPDVTLSNKQLGWNPNDAPPKDLLATTLMTQQHKTCRQAVERQMSRAPSSSYTTCRGFGF